MSPAGKNCLLLFVVAALLGVTSTQALSQAKRKGQPRSGRTARAGGSVQTSLTPTAAVRAYYRAINSEDITTARKYLSAGSIRLMEEGSRSRGKTLDEALREDARRKPAAKPTFANERIRGLTATVDVTMQGMTIAMSLVKEDGQWKMALDKMVEQGLLMMEPEPVAEGNYSEDEKHRLFQTVGITEDTDLIIEVAQKIGIVGSLGERKPNFDAFVKAHYEWAAVNAEFVRQHIDKEKAREYVMAHK